MMTAIRMFSAPHKALRRTMANFSVLAGQINISDIEAVEKLKSLGKEMFFLLTSHAKIEDQVILRALEAKLPGASEHDKLDHIKIERVQQQLEDLLEKLDTAISADEAYDFYLQFAAFHSLYLEHTNEEETVTQQVIWDHLTVEEQMAIRAAIMQRMDTETYAIWLKHMIPAQNDAENMMMITAYRKNMSAENFDLLIKILELIMPEDDFKSLKQKLNLTSVQY